MSRYYEALAKSLVAIVMLGAASLAHAQEGMYVSIQGGGSLLSDADIEDPTGLAAALGEEIEFDPGFNIGGSAGIVFRNNFRIEAEVNFARNDIDEFEVLGISFSADGDVDSLAFMGNAFYDFAIRPPWTLYVGGGAGVAIISIDDVKALGMSFPLKDDDDTVFAYQAGAGIGYAISPSTTLTLDYRFFATEDPEFEDEFGDPFEAEYSRHDLRVGLRFLFGQRS